LNYLFNSLNAKITGLQRLTDAERKRIQEMVVVPDSAAPQTDSFMEHLAELERECSLLERTKKEVSKMKSGSIALVNQIRTVSKIRIYDPKTNFDVLSGVKL
jgi:hypothetical protein